LFSARYEVALYICSGKGKGHPKKDNEGPEGNTGRALGGSQRHDPAALPPGKTRYPSYRRLVEIQDCFGRVRQISPPTGIRSPERTARSDSLYQLSYPGLLTRISSNSSSSSSGSSSSSKIMFIWCQGLVSVRT
jgi:hypothetical protein